MTHTVHQPSTRLPASGHASRLVEVAIATPIEAELVASIRAVSERVSLLYQPELLPPMRYPEDHRGVAGFRRAAESEGRWQELLTCAAELRGATRLVLGLGSIGGDVAHLAKPFGMRTFTINCGGASDSENETAGMLDAQAFERLKIEEPALVRASPLPRRRGTRRPSRPSALLLMQAP